MSTPQPQYRELELDALKEVCSIGAGHAATALSQLLDRKVLVTVPHLQIVGLSELPDIMGGPEVPVLATYVRVLGAITGSMLFMLAQESAIKLSNVLQGREGDNSGELKAADYRVIKQAGVVTLSSYLSALTRFIDVPLISSEASVAHDMAGGVLDTVAAELGTRADYALLVEADFYDEWQKITARIMFLPDQDAQQVILRKLGLK